MEKYTLGKDLYMICVRAASFPDGIMDAIQKLKQTESSIANRILYGISYGSENGILYWAAVEEVFNGELIHSDLNNTQLRKACMQQKR